MHESKTLRIKRLLNFDVRTLSPAIFILYDQFGTAKKFRYQIIIGYTQSIVHSL